jgi:hypothetical protein
MDAAARKLHGMIWNHAPVHEVRDFLLHEFGAASRLLSVPTYTQPNGFWTFKLGRDVDAKGYERMLRLHYWPHGLNETAETGGVHDHVFEFTSLVLSGYEPMINTYYETKRDPGSKEAVYEVVNINPQEQKVRKVSDDFRAVAVRRDIIPPGNYYDFPAGALHTSRIQNDGEAITLMATCAHPFTLNARFIAPKDIKIHPQYLRTPLNESQRGHVAQLLEYGF